MERLLVGVAWPYVNGPQHIGHLSGNLLPADIFSRYHRLKGDEVLMVSGSDMHGTPTSFQAEVEHISPEDLAMKYHYLNKEAFARLGISFDLYTNTHTKLHERTVQEIFLTLLEKGFLRKVTAESPYCEKQERFLPDRYVLGTCPKCGSTTARGDECDVCSSILEPKDLISPVCHLCGTRAVFRNSEHFYFDLPKLSDDLKKYHDTVKDHWRPSVRSFTENYLAGGLRMRPITRDILWGVPIPLEGYESKRIYVWFEAVIGYLSAAKEWAEKSGDPDAWRKFWVLGEEGKVYNFLGKDNITFHTILWPAILIALGGLKLPYDVPANEFMNLGGEKLSKSRTERGKDNPVFLPDLLEAHDPDVIRFYASYHMPENHDTDFDSKEMAHERDQILADQWGNLVHRVLTFVRSNYGGRIPSPTEGWSPFTSSLGNAIVSTWGSVGDSLEEVRLKEALDKVLEMVRVANRAFHDAKPWAAPPPEKATATYEAVWAVKAITIMLSPYIPFSSDKVAAMLGDPSLLQKGAWENVAEPPEPGTQIGDLVPLFPKPAKERKTMEGALPQTPPVLEITIGLVKIVENHPNAEKLFVLKIDCGQERPRTLVAGLRPYYKPEELVGKSVAILTNLLPRALRGITSEGMILAASDEKGVSAVRAPEGTPPGTKIVVPEGTPRMISHDEFQKVELVVAGAPGESGVPQQVGRNEGGVFTPLKLPGGGVLFPDKPVLAGSKIS